MLSITRQNVNVRNSNRVDNIVSDQVALGLLERLIQATRCYLHPVCLVLGQLRQALHLAMKLMLAKLVGSKRLALEPAPIPVSAGSPSRWQPLATLTGVDGRLTVATSTRGTTQLAG